MEEHVPLDGDLRSKLTRQLGNETYECLTWCDAVKTAVSVLSRGECYAVFYQRFIKRWRWAASSINQGPGG